MAGALAAAGAPVVELLYDPSDAEAGWMLQLLPLRVARACALGPCETCLFARGQTRYGFYRNVARTLWIWVGIRLGFALAGTRGLVWAIAASEVPVLLVLWPAARRAGMLRLRREALAPRAGYGPGTLAEAALAPMLRSGLHG